LNTKIAVQGRESGRMIVYDYTPGDTLGNGAALSGGRETEAYLSPGSRQGSAWIDDNTIVTMATDGLLSTVNATTMVRTDVGGALTPNIGSNSTALAYNPDISPYLFAMYGGFSAANMNPSQSVLFVFDPTNSYSLVNEVNLTGSMGSATARDIAFDEDGNLYIAGFSSRIHVIANAAANAATLADNTSVLWHTSALNDGIDTGIDVGWGEVVPGPDAGLDGDFNNDGVVDGADYVMWVKNPGANTYEQWVENFGNTSGGGGVGGSSAPEPASFALVAMGLVALCFRRRAA
jgi:hypothetical protein